jgi:4-amino-4-deoxy-L-arabinose transferase-like glycosyltransferase
VRLRKPVLPYWLVAAGCRLLGPSPFSTRILFVLCGGGVVMFSWMAARQATGSARAALLTALIVMCHPALFTSAARSLPDVVLSLFLTMSLAGFVGIIARGRADWSLLTCAYLGGALAVLSKGAPAVAFIAYASIYLAVFHRTLVLGHWTRFASVAVACVAISGSWFALMQHRHGDVLAQQFLGDQAGAHRFAVDVSQICMQAMTGAGLLAASFAVPLIPAARPLLRRRREAAGILDREVNHFLLGWCGLFLAAAACINHVNLRYLLPVVPAVGVILGCMLTELEGPLLRRNFRWIAWFSLLLPVAAGCIVVPLHWGTTPLLAIVAAAGIVATIEMLRRQLRFTSGVHSATVAAVGLYAAVFLCAWTGTEVMGRSFGRRMSEVVTDSGARELVLLGEPAHASRIRVCSSGTVRVVEQRRAKETPASPVASLDESLLPTAAEGFQRVRVPCGFNRIEPEEVAKALLRGELAELIRKRRREYIVAIPVDAPTEAIAEQTGAVAAQMAAETESATVIQR